MPPPDRAFRFVAGDTAELAELYAEVYAEPPYRWGEEHAELFTERFETQRSQPGFSLVEARHGGLLVGIAFGVTLQPTSPWWQNLLTPLPDAVTHEYPNRTFALVELLVRKPHRRRHAAHTMHDMILKDRTEERATLTVLPAAAAAQAAYSAWGWRKLAQKRNPLPGSPEFDVLLKGLHQPLHRRRSFRGLPAAETKAWGPDKPR